MVDNRIALKSSVEADLKKKIQCAQSALGDLQGAVQKVGENSAKAKGEVNQAVQEIQQLIGNHKLELTRQIEIICQKQLSCLQFEIQSMYLALGSLQSTLSNLDSFDHTQLLSLNIPNVSTTPNFAPSPVELKMNNAALNEIKEWGSVASNGQPKLPCTTKQNFDGFEISDIERVLSGVKLQASDADDFEIVSFESLSPIERSDSTEISEKQTNCNSERKSLAIMAAWQNEHTSNDLSKWLKTKKSSGKENSYPAEKSDGRPAFIHNPLKNRFVDFPCLRTDPKTWVPAKRARMNVSEFEYSRPAPIWLKKYS